MKLFGTDGIRALVNEENMSPEMGVKFGMALAAFCQKRKWPAKIVIGRDTRESGEMLEEAIISGVMAMGGEAIVAGVIPTPGLAYLVSEQKAGAGIVISASHNPSSYNGLKPIKGDGTKLTDEEEREMEEYILKGVPKKTGQDYVSGKKEVLAGAGKIYADFLLSKIFHDIKKSKMKLVIDCANGATFEIAPEIFRKIDEQVETLFVDPDGKNINDQCGSQHTQALREKVLAHGADMGLAFDGDGDRVIVVDEKGNVLTGDHIIYIIAKMMHEKKELKNDAVVTTIMSNLGFVSSLQKLGISHFSTGVGDRQVFFEMQKQGIVLGGEEAGHIIISTIHPAGDGMAAGLMLIAALDYFQKPLSELAGEVMLYPKILINTEVKSKPDFSTIPEIMEAIKKAENKLGEEGRVVVRYSGTENLARVMIEGKDEAEIKDLAGQIIKIIHDRLN